MMEDADVSPSIDEYVSAYDQAGSDQDWLRELSEEWVSNPSSEPSEQGSARGTSIRNAFGIYSTKIDTIPEEPETSTVRIVLAETDAHNTPEWKRRLDETKNAKDLFSPCHLENLFKEDTTDASIKSPPPVSPADMRHSTMKENPVTNTATFLKEITDNLSIISPKKTQQSSPLRQVFTENDLSSSPFQVFSSPPDPYAPRQTTGSTSSSGKSTMRSSNEKSTHESSDEDSVDSNEDLSVAEPTTTLMDASIFQTPRPIHDEITIHSSPPEEDHSEENSEEHTPDNLIDSTNDSFKTAKAMQTPHPNATSSLSSSSSQELKSRSVRFASPGDPSSFTFDFTPQPPLTSPISPERPSTPQSSSKNTPHNSPLKLFSRYDTFTKDKLGATVENLLPAPDAEDTDDLRMSRNHKRARREAAARDRIPRLPQNREIRHSRVASLTTQELVDDAEDFMRDLISMPRPNLEAEEHSAVEEDTADIADEVIHGEASSEYDENSERYIDYDQYSGSETYDSIRQTPSPGKLNVFSSPGRAVQLANSPGATKPAQATSRVSSAESMQVITPDDVSHLLHSTVGSMTYDKQKKAWFKIRPSQMHQRKKSEDTQEDVRDEAEQMEPEEEEDIFKDIDDLVVDEEEEEVQSNFSRPSSSRSGSAGVEKVSMIEEESQEQERESPMVKQTERVQEYHENEGAPQRYLPHHFVEDDDTEEDIFNNLDLEEDQSQIFQPPAAEIPKSPMAIPPKSPLRKSINVSPLPSNHSSPAKPQRTIAPSPLRKAMKVSIQDENIPPPEITVSPVRSPHRKSPSPDKRMRKSLPLPPLDTPEAIRIQDEMRLSSPDKMNPSPTRPQQQPLSNVATPQAKSNRKDHQDSPFLDPKRSLRLSISPPPADISFANTPRPDISFSVTTRTLVKHLTDFEPFEPYWENLKFVDFSSKGVTSLEGLKTFCPKLEAIDIKDCKVKYFTGLPSTMRVLKASGNRLDGLVSFAWGKNLQYLDLANNDIDSLAGLSSLVHLRELRVDNNKLTSLDGILQLDGLLKVSAKNNEISCLDFTGAKLSRLEVLACERNCIGWIEGLEELANLMSLHLDHNNLTSMQPRSPMRSLRTLKLCRNELENFVPKYYPELRTLYLDENQIASFNGLRKLRLLENFSARSQHGKSNIGVHGLTELRKVYLSGNTIPLRLDRPFYNLQYLELAAVKLNALPADFGSKVPNVRILNLSFNSIKDITPLRDLKLLKRLFLIGNRISSLSDGTTDTLVSLTELQVLDLRLNPITLSFYPPVEAKKSDHHKDMFSLVTGRQAQTTWQQRDKAFRNTLTPSWELRRKAYQGLIFTACPKLKWFDGSEVSRGSVAEGERMLDKLENMVSSIRTVKRANKA